jgi:hypothetical protein
MLGVEMDEAGGVDRDSLLGQLETALAIRKSDDWGLWGPYFERRVHRLSLSISAELMRLAQG